MLEHFRELKIAVMLNSKIQNLPPYPRALDFWRLARSNFRRPPPPPSGQNFVQMPYLVRDLIVYFFEKGKISHRDFL